jgi:hypothetical protein
VGNTKANFSQSRTTLTTNAVAEIIPRERRNRRTVRRKSLGRRKGELIERKENSVE